MEFFRPLLTYHKQVIYGEWIVMHTTIRVMTVNTDIGQKLSRL